MLKDALLKLIERLDASEELSKAVGSPFDTIKLGE